jgi:hypothetical protein
MGVMTEQAIAKQARKGQGETNDRLDALSIAAADTNEALSAIQDRLDTLIAAQARTNQLLEWIGQRLPAGVLP